MKTKQLLARHIRARHRTVGNRLQSSRFMNSKVSCVNRPVLLSPYKTASAKTPKRKRQWDSISNEPSLFLDLNYSSKAVQTWRFDFLPAIVFYLYFIIFFFWKWSAVPHVKLRSETRQQRRVLPHVTFSSGLFSKNYARLVFRHVFFLSLRSSYSVRDRPFYRFLFECTNFYS